MKKIAAIALASVIAASGLSALSAGASAEWVKSSSGYSYKDDSTGKKLTGWQKIGGKKYYFDKKGIALTGWKKINGDTYYFSASKKGQMLTSWAKIGNEKYYFGSDGIMRTGWVKLNGDTYYFGNDGVMRTGTIKTGGAVYKFDKNGVLISRGSADNIPWGKTSDDIAEMLEEKDMYYFIRDGRMYAKGEDAKIYIYSFDEDDKLSLYGTLEEGDYIDSIKKDLKQRGYTQQEKERNENGDVAYAYATSDSVAIFGLYEQDGDEYSIILYLSPSYSKMLIEEGYDKISELAF